MYSIIIRYTYFRIGIGGAVVVEISSFTVLENRENPGNVLKRNDKI